MSDEEKINDFKEYSLAIPSDESSWFFIFHGSFGDDDDFLEIQVKDRIVRIFRKNKSIIIDEDLLDQEDFLPDGRIDYEKWLERTKDDIDPISKFSRVELVSVFNGLGVQCDECGHAYFDTYVKVDGEYNYCLNCFDKKSDMFKELVDRDNPREE